MIDVRARQGRLIAGVGGLMLFGFLFLPWFGEGGLNSTGWEGQSTTDIYLLITAMVAVAAALPSTRALLLPGVTMPGAAALLGGVGTVLLIWLSFIDFPSGADRKVGVYLALLAAIVITIGGYMSAQGGPATSPSRART
jgi:hypothetical protein